MIKSFAFLRNDDSDVIIILNLSQFKSLQVTMVDNKWSIRSSKPLDGEYS